MINQANEKFKYLPVLSISPAEMTALEELPDKDKDAILPIIPLKGWVGSQKLENSIQRILKAIGKRSWIADIDASFLQDNQEKIITGKYPRDVFDEIEALLSPQSAYENWFRYLSREECSNAIPTLQISDESQLEQQIKKLSSLGRGIVARFSIEHINTGLHTKVLEVLKNLAVQNALIVFDYGQVNREILTFAAAISSIINKSSTILPNAAYSISCSSFPASFSGSNIGENPIYERQLFNNIRKACPSISLIYSDRGSARADKIGGGGGIPSPRIDYPLNNDWRFVREEFADSNAPEDGEKEELYTLIANTIMKSNFWQPDLRVWGTQVIELTSKGEMLGINSPMRSTAVRINIHMHQQLYYDDPSLLLDTDEDWTD